MTAPHVTFLRQNQTSAEQRLWQQLRAKRSIPLRFRRQYPIGSYVADFVCLAARLIIEIDGESHNHTIEADEQRTRWLENQGFRVIRFMNSDVLKNTEGVVQAIQNELASTPPPTPPAREGGEVKKQCSRLTTRGERKEKLTPFPCGRG
jgi:very-short-patch-repair endonuclease